MGGQRYKYHYCGSAADTANISDRPATIIAIYVVQAGAGSSVSLINDTSGSTEEFAVSGVTSIGLPIVNCHFGKGIRRIVTGTAARFLIIYEN